MSISNDRPICDSCGTALTMFPQGDVSAWLDATEHLCFECADSMMHDTCARCENRECDRGDACPHPQPFTDGVYFAHKLRVASFTVYAEFFDAILDGTKDVEIRPDTDHWHKRLVGDTPPLQQAVFISGQRVYRCDVVDVRVGPPRLVLGRELTDAEAAVVKTQNVIAVWLGDVVSE